HGRTRRPAHGAARGGAYRGVPGGRRRAAGPRDSAGRSASAGGRAGPIAVTAALRGAALASSLADDAASVDRSLESGGYRAAESAVAGPRGGPRPGGAGRSRGTALHAGSVAAGARHPFRQEHGPARPRAGRPPRPL